MGSIHKRLSQNGLWDTGRTQSKLSINKRYNGPLVHWKTDRLDHKGLSCKFSWFFDFTVTNTF